MKKNASGLEELARVKRMVLTRADTRAEADVLFGGTAKDMRQADREKLKKLFVQMEAAQTMAPNLQKEARIFGESKPGGIDNSAIPYKIRQRQFKEYAKEKAREKPTGYGKAIGTGALVGGGVGLLGGVPGALGGAAIGGLTGALAAAHDKANIRSAERALRKGGLDDELAKVIARKTRDREQGRELRQDIRHWELMRGLEKRSSVSPQVDAFFEKVAQASLTDAQRRYPELLKVANAGRTAKVPEIRKRTSNDATGETPTKSDIAGGSP